MKVKLNEISEQGLTVSEAFDPEALNLQTLDLKFVAPVKVRATFHRERNTVLVNVAAEGENACICGRCLSVYPRRYRESFDLDYTVRDEIFLDVTDDIRQEILLSYPVKFLCRSDCSGLCPRCGKNLNQEPCSCPTG